MQRLCLCTPQGTVSLDPLSKLFPIKVIMQIIKISPIGFGANTYAVTSDGKNAVVIDPAHSRVADDLKKRGLTAKFVLLTHCHFDHVGGVASLQQSGAKVFCSDKEKPLVGTRADLFDMAGLARPPYTIDETLCDNESRELCGMTVQTLITPGHTAGGACYLFTAKDGGRCLFTGDTLFAGTIGRTDFPTGDIGELRASLRRLCDTFDDVVIYPGHEEETTLARERKTNPFID